MCLKMLLIGLVLMEICFVLWQIRQHPRLFFTVWKHMRPRILIECLGMLTLTSGLTLALWFYLPFMRFGWTGLVFHHPINVILSPSLALTQSHLSLVPTTLLLLTFFVILVLCIPFWAHLEETIFRSKRIVWRAIIPASVLFGLVHLLMGVPLASALPLVLWGLFYGYQYRRAFLASQRTPKSRTLRVSPRSRQYQSSLDTHHKHALMTSTAYHTLTNTIVIILLTATLVLEP